MVVAGVAAASHLSLCFLSFANFLSFDFFNSLKNNLFFLTKLQTMAARPSEENCPVLPKLAEPYDGTEICTPVSELDEMEVEPPLEHNVDLLTTVKVCVSFGMMGFFAVVRDTYRKLVPAKKSQPGYAPIVSDFDDLWQRRFYRRGRDCWNRPIDSRPSRIIGVMERVSHDYNVSYQYTGKILPAINMGSYNYLGFAEDTPSITNDVLDCIDDYGLAACSAPQGAGQHQVLSTLEKEFAAFLGKEDALVCGMGFNTNLCGLPSLVGKGSLIVSDSINHCSLVDGARSAGAKVMVFQHGMYDQLESILHDAVVYGRDPTGPYVPYDRIVMVVEGVYSMEGEIIDLRRVVTIKKKYKCLLFVDEAHSIGALGRTGRGVCEHCGVPPKHVDVLMGTFTKSFGSIGGYIAADKKIIDWMRQHGSISLYCDSLTPPCAQQVVSVLNVLLGRTADDLGRRRLQQLRENSRFFRQGLIDMGLIVMGDDASPVVPVMVYNAVLIAELSRRCLEMGLAIVVVGYPATPILRSRIRFCVSACHTREDLQLSLDIIKLISQDYCLGYHKDLKKRLLGHIRSLSQLSFGSNVSQ